MGRNCLLVEKLYYDKIDKNTESSVRCEACEAISYKTICVRAYIKELEMTPHRSCLTLADFGIQVEHAATGDRGCCHIKERR